MLYVENTAASAAFYADLLARQPLSASPTFALFALDSGIKLGLWARAAAQPQAYAAAGSAELAIRVADRSVVNDMHADWAERGVTIAQRPVQMDFGYTFLAVDRDGHRLRVFMRD
jgi:catechol 2,3-dioxygenase-like lactoylglutathione lyase family enzyme